MAQLDAKSSLLAGLAGGIALIVIVQVFDYVDNTMPPLYANRPTLQWALMGFILGFAVQVAERWSGAS